MSTGTLGEKQLSEIVTGAVLKQKTKLAGKTTLKAFRM